MDEDMEAYCLEVTEYIIGRTAPGGSVFKYYEKDIGGSTTFKEFIFKIVCLGDSFTLEEAEDSLPNESESGYVARKTGYSEEIVEEALWFRDCYMMANDNCTLIGVCPECGHDVLYLREVEGSMFDQNVECGSCGRIYTFDVFLEDEDEDDSWFDPDEELDYNEELDADDE